MTIQSIYQPNGELVLGFENLKGIKLGPGISGIKWRIPPFLSSTCDFKAM